MNGGSKFSDAYMFIALTDLDLLLSQHKIGKNALFWTIYGPLPRKETWKLDD